MESIPVTVLTTLTGAVAAALGALLHFLFARISSKSDFQRDRETESYISFINSVSAVSQSLKSGDKKKHAENLEQLTAAKCKISIMGSHDVIHMLSHFERGGAVLDSSENAERYRDLINAMRISIGKKKKISSEEFTYILLGGPL